MHFYNKSYRQNGKKITEVYVNDELTSYYEGELKPNFKILRGFCPEGKMFHTMVTYLDCNNEPFMHYIAVKTFEGEIKTCYRRIDKNGEQSEQGYDNFFTCYFKILPN